MSAHAESFGDRRLASIFVVPPAMWTIFLCAFAALTVALLPSLRVLMDVWFESEDLGYGPVLPFVCVFLVWQQRDVLDRSRFTGSWWGVAVLFVASVIALIGQRATVLALAQFGFVVALVGLTWSITGWPVFRKLLPAFCVLLLAIPLPAFLLTSLSLELQLLSSKIGVAIVRLFGISVFLEGNVIDLGVYKLEVAEACSGLRYLFPLLTLGFLMAYFFKVPFWKRALLFVSSVPIAILMNSLRIGVIGVMVDRWGTAMAEGFLHEFQGWAVFMTSIAVMIGEMILLSRIGRDPRPWREVFGLEFPPKRASDAERVRQSIHTPMLVALGIAAMIGAISLLLPQRAEAVPMRESLILFPNHIGPWNGQRAALEPVYLDALKLDDYVMEDYRRYGKPPVNFYIAWYNSQRSGQSAHSPRSCLPGGGWHIDSLKQVPVSTTVVNGAPLIVNRMLISQGEQRQLTYYWFQQRGRVVTSEYLVKWYLFWDALTRNRSDGALVRLIVPLSTSANETEADATLTEFAEAVAPTLPRFVPN